METSRELHNKIKQAEYSAQLKVEAALKNSGLVVENEQALVKFATELVLIAAELGGNTLLNALL